MIVIEPVGSLPYRSRYPGQYQLPVLIPPSPEGSDRPLPERKKSFWFFALIGGIFAAVALSGSESADSLGYFVTPAERKRGRKLVYLWKYYGRSGKPTTVRRKNVPYFKKRSGVEGELYPIHAYSADHARELIRERAIAPYRPGEMPPKPRPAPTPKIPPSPAQIPRRKGEKGIQARMDETIREMEEYLAKIQREKAERLRMSKKSPPAEPTPAEQLTLFAGRIANCAIWIPDGYGGWSCGMYGRVCDSPTCAKPTQEDSKQTRVCVKTQKVFSKFLKKKVSRCKRYEATCTGPACMPFTMPLPEEKSERTKARKDEVRSYAEWMAIQYNEEHFEKIPYLAREILDRGGIKPPRTPYGIEPPKKQVEEYTMIPLFLRNREGMACDEMANEMGYKYCDELREDILKAYPQKTKGAWKKIKRKTWRDFEEDARWEIEEKLYSGEWKGLAGSPGRVWRSTYLEFMELQRTKDDPALSKELNWILQRTKTNPEGSLRVFKGDLPAHMKRRVRDWLFDRYQHPERLKVKGMKVDMRSGRKVTDYILNHPYYTVVVRFWSGGTVSVMENRANYHAESVREAIAEGKDVPRKVLNEYAPYMPEAKKALTGGLGQDLFPELKRELRFDPPEDIATSDDPVIACMQRLGWKLPRIEELKASIAEKMTPDLFTMKIKPLSPGEKEYQRIVGECLEQRAGTA